MKHNPLYINPFTQSFFFSHKHFTSILTFIFSHTNYKKKMSQYPNNDPFFNNLIELRNIQPRHLHQTLRHLHPQTQYHDILNLPHSVANTLCRLTHPNNYITFNNKKYLTNNSNIYNKTHYNSIHYHHHKPHNHKPQPKPTNKGPTKKGK